MLIQLDQSLIQSRLDSLSNQYTPVGGVEEALPSSSKSYIWVKDNHGVQNVAIIPDKPEAGGSIDDYLAGTWTHSPFFYGSDEAAAGFYKNAFEDLLPARTESEIRGFYDFVEKTERHYANAVKRTAKVKRDSVLTFVGVTAIAMVSIGMYGALAAINFLQDPESPEVIGFAIAGAMSLTWGLYEAHIWAKQVYGQGLYKLRHSVQMEMRKDSLLQKYFPPSLPQKIEKQQ